MKMICRYVILSFPLSLQASIYLEIYELESFLGFIECFFFPTYQQFLLSIICEFYYSLLPCKSNEVRCVSINR